MLEKMGLWFGPAREGSFKKGRSSPDESILTWCRSSTCFVGPRPSYYFRKALRHCVLSTVCSKGIPRGFVLSCFMSLHIVDADWHWSTPAGHVHHCSQVRGFMLILRTHESVSDENFATYHALKLSNQEEKCLSLAKGDKSSPSTRLQINHERLAKHFSYTDLYPGCLRLDREAP